ncbi:hypothetical protein SAMN04488026_107810 [Aliiruegeria lutimaris]|uniref:Uncharacterized protein n=1 Tax=Aliiruegeria lutimaris TaxID=571298 RepID=A0A1G9J315_9RHOB|nr:hypothetical protein SAMN04488026_107810 [Aliiruegeria lutimaris]
MQKQFSVGMPSTPQRVVEEASKVLWSKHEQIICSNSMTFWANLRNVSAARGFSRNAMGGWIGHHEEYISFENQENAGAIPGRENALCASEHMH